MLGSRTGAGPTFVSCVFILKELDNKCIHTVETKGNADKKNNKAFLNLIMFLAVSTVHLWQFIRGWDNDHDDKASGCKYLEKKNRPAVIMQVVESAKWNRTPKIL